MQNFIQEVLQQQPTTSDAIQYMIAYQCNGPQLGDGTSAETLTPYDKVRAMFAQEVSADVIRQALECTDGACPSLQAALTAPPPYVL